MEFTTFLKYFLLSMLIYQVFDIIFSVALQYIFYRIKKRKMRKALEEHPDLNKALAGLFEAAPNKDKKTWN